MASSILHIKDSYYFEVPKFLWPVSRDGAAMPASDGGFPDWLVKLDPNYLDWHAQKLHGQLVGAGVQLPSFDELSHDYHAWLHEGTDHANVGKPLDAYLLHAGLVDAGQLDSAKNGVAPVSEYREHLKTTDAEWSAEKIEGYSEALSGKILIPQPFGTLKNLYEPASGFCVSKFMVIEVAVALIVGGLFIGLANRMRTAKGGGPKGRLSNALEAMLLYMRDEVARPAIGEKEGDRYVPLLWTMFFFVLGCNLMGMIPWVGAPTGAFGCTLGLAGVTFATGVVMGSKKFGILGFWKNQVPSMDLPFVMAIVLKPMLWVIEVAGLMIKHLVLAIRLLANMFAGHVVLLGIMGLAFSWHGAVSDTWWLAAPIAVISSTLFSILELFVAFLQAYVFTFLSALFIGAAVHHH